ncbi:heterokaryon incompatibility protein-domain-containing protein [Dactylonectria macrodidyma]|uniref:Heterokaryon incompatibility protein-domain-containing protein n=1 Tax=Dactylonectria macrodidyma TaxID=307937 RepID=A0A9P9IKW3_9HYPO|nr:heterokaryon incompatibility protein-domain-containing protein [Dactylonectria macrodidyma]
MEPDLRTAEHPSYGGHQGAPISLRSIQQARDAVIWLRATPIVLLLSQMIRSTFIRLVTYAIMYCCIAVLSVPFKRGLGRSLGITISSNHAKGIMAYLLSIIVPMADTFFARYQLDIYFHDLIMATRQLRTFNMAGYIVELVKNIMFKGVFVRRTSPQESYTYTNFPPGGPFVRLLKYRRIGIFPLFDHKFLKYSIEIFPLDKTPEYTAISYTWGCKTLERRIAIDNGTVLSITTSALECLVALKGRRRYLWIDSICINQSDEFEKAEQVKIMRDIYKRADDVVAVLGNSTLATISPEVDNHTSELLRHFFRFYGMATLLPRIPIDEKRCEDANGIFSTMIRDNNSPWKSKICRVVCHPYWTRVWIIQELSVAKRVLVYFEHRFRELDSQFKLAEACPTIEQALAGPNTTFPDAKKMYQALLSKFQRTVNSPERDIEEELSKLYSRGIDHMLSIRDIRRSIHESQSSYKTTNLWDVMLRSMGSVATDARDKVFAVIGLVSSNVVGDVSITIATSNENQINLLLGGIGWARCQSDLPSWVVDWTSLSHLYPKGYRSVMSTSVYQADWSIRNLGVKAHNQFVPLNRASILGIFCFIDKIRFASDIIEPNGQKWFSDMWNTICTCLGKSYDWSTWSCPLEEAIWRTLLAQSGTKKPRDHCYDEQFHVEECVISKHVDLHDDILALRSEGGNHTCRKDVDKAFLAWSPVHTVSCDEKARALLSDRFSQALAHTRAIGCRFVVTENGYVGTVPPKSMVGDEIFIHPTCRVPVLLRKVAARNFDMDADYKFPCYQLVGACFVLGLMSGEPSCDRAAYWKYSMGRVPLADRKIVLV